MIQIGFCLTWGRLVPSFFRGRADATPRIITCRSQQCLGSLKELNAFQPTTITHSERQLMTDWLHSQRTSSIPVPVSVHKHSEVNVIVLTYPKKKIISKKLSQAYKIRRNAEISNGTHKKMVNLLDGRGGWLDRRETMPTTLRNAMKSKASNCKGTWKWSSKVGVWGWKALLSSGSERKVGKVGSWSSWTGRMKERANEEEGLAVKYSEATK